MLLKSHPITKSLQRLAVIFLFGFFISPHFASATTIVPSMNSGGYFTGDVVWTKANSPYVVTDAYFTNTSSLTIEPGTIVKLNQGYYGITVRGRLKVGSATSTEKVYFTSIKDDMVGGDTNNDGTSTVPQAGDWSGLSFVGSDGTMDEAGGTTVQTTATSTLITDESSNTLSITFSKLKQEGKEIKLQMQGLYYNGISTSTIPKTTLQYEWSINKMEDIKELEQKVTVGTLEVQAHYDAKKNVTEIRTTTELKKDNHKKTLSGLVIIGVKTEKGSFHIDY